MGGHETVELSIDLSRFYDRRRSVPLLRSIFHFLFCSLSNLRSSRILSAIDDSLGYLV